MIIELTRSGGSKSIRKLMDCIPYLQPLTWVRPLTAPIWNCVKEQTIDVDHGARKWRARMS